MGGEYAPRFHRASIFVPYLPTKISKFECYPFSRQPLVFTCLLKNFVRKGEIARNEQFLLFPQSFLPIQRTFHHLRQIQNCRMQTLSVWKSPKFVVWKGLNNF